MKQNCTFSPMAHMPDFALCTNWILKLTQGELTDNKGQIRIVDFRRADFKSPKFLSLSLHTCSTVNTH